MCACEPGHLSSQKRVPRISIPVSHTNDVETKSMVDKVLDFWELFRRQPGNKQTTKEKFAQELKRKVTNMIDGLVGSKVQEKYLLDWMNEL